jgi:hypothetical protein
MISMEIKYVCIPDPCTIAGNIAIHSGQLAGCIPGGDSWYLIRHTCDGQIWTVEANLQLWLMGNALDMTGTCVRSNLDSARFDIALELIKTRVDFACPPRRNAAVKYRVHLLERLALGLRRCQEHVDKSEAVEGSEDLYPTRQ